MPKMPTGRPPSSFSPFHLAHAKPEPEILNHAAPASESMLAALAMIEIDTEPSPSAEPLLAPVSERYPETAIPPSAP
jgi:hypothetical protein